jgi:hypothetical protein
MIRFPFIRCRSRNAVAAFPHGDHNRWALPLISIVAQLGMRIVKGSSPFNPIPTAARESVTVGSEDELGHGAGPGGH